MSGQQLTAQKAWLSKGPVTQSSCSRLFVMHRTCLRLLCAQIAGHSHSSIVKANLGPKRPRKRNVHPGSKAEYQGEIQKILMFIAPMAYLCGLLDPNISKEFYRLACTKATLQAWRPLNSSSLALGWGPRSPQS